MKASCLSSKGSQCFIHLEEVRLMVFGDRLHLVKRGLNFNIIKCHFPKTGMLLNKDLPLFVNIADRLWHDPITTWKVDGFCVVQVSQNHGSSDCELPIDRESCFLTTSFKLPIYLPFTASSASENWLFYLLPSTPQHFLNSNRLVYFL